MRIILIVTIILLLFSPIIVSADKELFINNPIINQKFVPRKAMFADKPGNYELVIRTLNPTLAPGGVIKYELYITGYGNIHGAKIYFLVPPDFIYDDGTSYIRYGVNKVKVNVNNIEMIEAGFGGNYVHIVEPGGVIELNEIGRNREESSLFIDMFPIDNSEVPRERHMIFTENKAGNAPFTFYIQTRKDVCYGKHQLKVYLTYFNGHEWKSSVASTDVEVQTFMQRNGFITWIIGIFFAFFAVFLGCINVWNILTTRKEEKIQKEIERVKFMKRNNKEKHK